MPGAIDPVAEFKARSAELEKLRKDLSAQLGVKLPPSIPARQVRLMQIYAAGLGLLGGVTSVALVPFILGSAFSSRFPEVPGWVGVLTVLVAAAAVTLAGLLSWPDRVERAWGMAEKITASSLFYFFAGIWLLLYAINTAETMIHPSLTFLLAMLGVAIMLFGTGSQAVGSIATGGVASGPAVAAAPKIDAALAAAQETHETILLAEAAPTDAEKSASLPGLRTQAEKAVRLLAEAAAEAKSHVTQTARGAWGSFGASAAVAGGAAVLAAVFGYGVVVLQKDIKEVFGQYDRYVRVRIEACASFEPTCSVGSEKRDHQLPAFTLRDYVHRVELVNGTPVFSVISGNEIQLLIFTNALEGGATLRLELDRSTPNPNLGDEVEGHTSVYIPLEDLRRKVGSASRPAFENEQQSAEACTQFKERELVSCALKRVGGASRGEHIKTVIYTLNMYRKENVRSAATINNVEAAENVEVAFE